MPKPCQSHAKAMRKPCESHAKAMRSPLRGKPTSRGKASATVVTLSRADCFLSQTESGGALSRILSGQCQGQGEGRRISRSPGERCWNVLACLCLGLPSLVFACPALVLQVERELWNLHERKTAFQLLEVCARREAHSTTDIQRPHDARIDKSGCTAGASCILAGGRVPSSFGHRIASLGL